MDVTGDAGILDATTAFSQGPRLKQEEREAYFQPSVLIDQATIFEHCRLGHREGHHVRAAWIAPDGDERLERWHEQRGR